MLLLRALWWLSWYLEGFWEQRLLQSCEQLRTSTGFNIFSEMSLALAFAGRARTHDRSEHKLKIKLKYDPLLNLSTELHYSPRHDHTHVWLLPKLGNAASFTLLVLCRSVTALIQRSTGFTHTTHSTEHLHALCWQQGFCKAAFSYNSASWRNKHWLC